MRKFVLAASFLSLGACGTLDTGQVDYRYAPPAEAISKAQLDAKVSSCQSTAVSRSTKLPDGSSVTHQNHCAPLSETHLQFQYVGADTSLAFDPAPNAGDEDVYSINLLRGRVGENVMESFGADPSEILILANVFEMDDSGTQNPRGFAEIPDIRLALQDSDKATNSARMKVVYFSPDIEKNQTYNLSNIPIVPPTKYNGKPLALQFVILELDRLPNPVKSLLQKMAEIGQVSNKASLGFSVDNLLLELGSSIIEGQSRNDDVLMEFRMTLDPYRAGTVSPGPVFVPGRYVVRRHQERQREILWRNVFLDNNRGILVKKTDGRYEPFVEDHYLVVNITKHPPGTKEAAFGQSNISEFNALLDAASEIEGGPAVAAINAELDKLIVEKRSSSLQNSIRGKWYEARTAWQQATAARVPLESEFGKDALADCKPAQGTAFRDATFAYRRAQNIARTQTHDFTQAYYEALQKKGEPDASGSRPDEFKSEHRLSIMRSIGEFVLPYLESGDPAGAHFVKALDFETAYVDLSKMSALPDLLEKAQLAQAEPFDCGNLIDMKIATGVSKPDSADIPAGEVAD